MRSMPDERVVIVGAGPCGLAAARELSARSTTPFTVLEASDGPGGLAASRIDANGFTWDRGGHVVFSHYGEFDRLLAEVMGDDVHHHERSSFVRVGESWVPYPFQNNLHRLPADVAEQCLSGLIEASTTQPAPPADPGAELDFATWMAATFGSGIVEHFMRPYNEKVWAQPASAMSAQWMAERVATVDWRQAVHAVVHREDDVAWGPNNLFAFPTTGGTGEIYTRAARDIDTHIRYRCPVEAVDPEARSLTTADGEVISYTHLLWTGPLDQLVALLSTVPDDVTASAGALVHNSVTVVGVGYETPLTDDRSWLYFPDPDVPFYRATNFAKYAAANVPDGRTDRYCSWMTEIASSSWRPLDEHDIGRRVDAALRQIGLVPNDAAIATVHIDHVEYGYPVPTLGRDAALATIQPWLMQHDILARGRFGAWRYELGNMDHAVKMGIDAAHRIIDGTPEQAWAA